MELITMIGPSLNLLPYDGVAEYYPQVFTPLVADTYLSLLFTEIAWMQDEIHLFGKKIVTKRSVAWYGDKPFAYTYSRTTKIALPCTDTLRAIKAQAETVAATSFNSCLLNLYHDGSEGMGWHSDDEKELVANGPIASVSFGAERKFQFRHKPGGTTVNLRLQHGSLLLMKGETQQNWMHQLPVTKSIHSPRINLTFRKFVDNME